jgi:plasmid maintenance system antidote protein VapI
MVLRLAQAFPHTEAGFWLNLQKNYELWQAQQHAQEWQQIRPLFAPDALPASPELES